MALQNFVDRALPTISAAWLNAVDRLKEYISDSSDTTRGDALVAVQRTATGAVATDVHRWIEAQHLNTHADFGLVPDGVTSHTSAIIAKLTALSAAGFRGCVHIPYGTKFAPSTLFAAVPVGIKIDDRSSINWGQPPTYRSNFHITYSSDIATDDSQTVFASPYHAAIMLLNTGTAPGSSASERLGTILHGVGKDYSDDPLLSWLLQFGKAPGENKFACTLRAQTPYSVAINNPQLWATATAYTAGDHCISDSGKVYLATNTGTSGATAPTGTGTGISDGAVVWDYVQASLSLDTTRFSLYEDGWLDLFGKPAVSQRLRMSANSLSHYMDISGATGAITWRDETRGKDIVKVTTADGTQMGGVQSFPFVSVSGATPALTSSYAYVNNGGATTMTDMTMPSGQTSGYVMLLAANANTSITHGTNFVLKGAASLSPLPASGCIEFIKYPTQSSSWIEIRRSF